jgi:hypothetical protein
VLWFACFSSITRNKDHKTIHQTEYQESSNSYRKILISDFNQQSSEFKDESPSYSKITEDKLNVDLNAYGDASPVNKKADQSAKIIREAIRTVSQNKKGEAKQLKTRSLSQVGVVHRKLGSASRS